MRLPSAPDDPTELEIVEVDDPVDPYLDAPVPELEDDGLDRARQRIVRWAGFGVLVVLVAIAVGVNAVQGRAQAERRAALAELAWVLPAMDGPFDEVWRASDVWVVAETAEVLVTSTAGGGGVVQGIDISSGEVRWEWVGPEWFDRCGAVVDSSAGDGQAPDVVPSAPELLLCRPRSGYALEAPPPVGSSSTVTFLDIGSGAEVASATVEGALLVDDAVDGDVLLTVLHPDAAIGVVRVDPRTGEMRWTYRSEPGLLPEGMPNQWGYRQADGVLQVGGGVDLAISLDTGVVAAVVDAPAGDPFVGRVELADGGTAEWLYGDFGIGGTGLVRDPDGSVRFEFAGSPWWPSPTDASSADVLVVQDEGQVDGSAQGARLAGLDAATGDELWVVADSYSVPVFQIDGLVLAYGFTAAVLDVRDGRWLWVHPVDQTAIPSPLTDGEVVVLPVREGEEAQLVAVGLRTGTEEWRMPAPDGVYDVHAAGDVVLMVTGDEVVAYR